MLQINSQRLSASLSKLDFSKKISLARCLEALLPTPRTTKYFPKTPLPIKQRAFLCRNEQEVFYGGGGGGGKSHALLLAALQYVDIPGYHALILRRTFADLDLPGALMDTARQLLRPYEATGDVIWHKQEHRFEFTSGARLQFGYLEHDDQMYRYQGGGWHYVAFDEVAQFKEKQYQFLFGWQRKTKSMMAIPLRVRSASNPIGRGKEWVKQRFLIEGKQNGRVFIPARAKDNPYLDYDSYVKSLMNLDPITRRQILDGDWDARQPGSMFRREWFTVVDDDKYPLGYRTVRYWDLAATEENGTNDPDYTVGLKMTYDGDKFWVLDVQRVRKRPGEVEKLVINTAEADGLETEVHMEEEGGSSGKSVIEDYAKKLNRFIFQGHRNTGPDSAKILRIGRVASQAEAKNIKLVRGPWLNDFFSELEALPDGPHDDVADSCAGAYSVLVDDAIDLSGLYAGGQRLNYEAQISS